MASFWKHYDPVYKQYEHSLPPAFSYNRARNEDTPRYQLGNDGYWYNPSAVDSSTALLSCTGDLMCEPRMTNAHRYGDSYFFHPLFRHVRSILRGSDFCIANLETTLSESTPYAGDYHCIAGKYHCNAPACYLDAVRYAGFDALVTANNHNCDSGIGGLWDTLRAIDEHRFMRTGSFLPTDRRRVLLVKVCGIRIAVLSYGNRYNSLDERHFTQDGIHTCLNWFTPEKCRADVAYAREHGAEFVLCYQHWGRDYDEEPNEQQHRILSELQECGVDYIVGSHTHCLQSHHEFTTRHGRRIPMMWSMGNFVTNERKELCKHTGILQLILRREANRITVEEQFVPCYVFDQFETGRFCVVPTGSVHNGGYTHPRMPEIETYIRNRIGPDLPFLPDRTVTLSQLCEAMGLACTLPHRPVTKLCTQSGAVRYGAVYFVLNELTLADKRRLIAADVAAVITPEPIDGLPCLITPDVAAAYRAAHALLRPLGNAVTTVLVAGHTGKTVTRELVARVLRAQGGVFTVNDDEHSDLSPWQDLHPYHHYCVLELRNDHPLSAREATALCAPDILVLTAFPCDVAALADGLQSGGILWYNAADTALCAAVNALMRTDITVRPYKEAVPCSALPFDSFAPCTAAAAAIGRAEGVSEQAIGTAVEGYRINGYTNAVLAVDGVTLVLNTNCKTMQSAESALRASPHAAQRIAVTTAAFAEAAASWATTQIVINDTTDLAAAEQELLTLLQDGATVFICGEREACLCDLVRRVFGLTDGFIPGAS